MTRLAALILVDLQNDFLPGGALAVKDGDQVIPIANQLQSAFELVVATQDWHPSNHGSFAANHRDLQPGHKIELAGLEQILWPTHCVEGTWGADFAPTLQHDRWTQIFRKGTDPAIDSYSGFFDNGRRKATGLGEFLQTQGIHTVYVMGLATDYCVKYTAIDARRLGLNTCLVEDGCRGVELHPGDCHKAIQEMHAAGVRSVLSAEVLKK